MVTLFRSEELETLNGEMVVKMSVMSLESSQEWISISHNRVSQSIS
jgi:hypothetical protein